MAIIWLGTNDADRFKDNWSEAVDEDYLASYRDLLSKLKTANPDMKIILLNPCYCAIDYWEASIEAHVLSLVEQVTEETGYPMFDMHSYTQNAFGEFDFADKLHPSDSGYVIVAEKVAELIDIHDGWLRDIMTCLSEEEQKQFENCCERLLAAAEKLTLDNGGIPNESQKQSIGPRIL